MGDIDIISVAEANERCPRHDSATTRAGARRTAGIDFLRLREQR